MNEETIFEGNVTNDQSPISKDCKKNANVADKAKGKKRLGAASAAGIAGVASYAAGVFTPLQVFPSETGDLSENTENTGNTTALSEHHIGHDLDVATGVDDSMSFSEAFAAARAEVGAGGVFVWHGNTYGTYYAGEWNSMSEEDKEQYWANVHHTSANLSNEIDNSTGDVNAGSAIPETGVEEQIGGVEVIPQDPPEGWESEPGTEEPVDGMVEVPLEPTEGWETEPEHEELIGETDELNITGEGNLGEEDVVNVSAEEVNEIWLTSDDDNEISHMDSDDYSSEEATEDNPDIDILASNSFDQDIPIENDLDMGEYV